MVFYQIAFALFAASHLAACLFKWKSYRTVSKCFLVPFLIIGVLIKQIFDPLLLLGLFLGWLGDVLLIFEKSQKCFVFGAASFALGHFSYIAATLVLFFEHNTLADIQPFAYIAWVAITVVLFLVSALSLGKKLGPIAYLGSAYFSTLAAAFVISLSSGRWLLAAAFGVFITSDIILSVCKFGKRIKGEDFLVMSTYIAAQTLICVSFIYG